MTISPDSLDAQLNEDPRLLRAAKEYLAALEAGSRSDLGAELSTQRSERAAEFFRNVARLVALAAEGLEYAYGLGIIHRDVKPECSVSGARLFALPLRRKRQPPIPKLSACQRWPHYLQDPRQSLHAHSLLRKRNLPAREHLH
jgi:hypothetical protein